MTTYAPAHAPRPRPHRSDAYRKALRVAGTITALKWILIVLAVLGLVVGGLYGLTTFEGSDVEGIVLVGLAAAGVLATLLVVILVWVLFGWFEHVLRVLVSIADHTWDD